MPEISNIDDEQEKWIDDVFDSLEGSHRASPDKDLFQKIESAVGESIDERETPVIPLRRFRIAAAAAVLLLLLNVVSIQQYNQRASASVSETSQTRITTTSSTETLISDYKLYDL